MNKKEKVKLLKDLILWYKNDKEAIFREEFILDKDDVCWEDFLELSDEKDKEISLLYRKASDYEIYRLKNAALTKNANGFVANELMKDRKKVEEEKEVADEKETEDIFKEIAIEETNKARKPVLKKADIQ